MPNYVQNRIRVWGDSELLVKFIKRHIDSDGCFDFNTVIPEPKYKVETSSKYIIKDEEDAREHFLGWSGPEDWFNWYDWRKDYWNTKWNADGMFNMNFFDCGKILSGGVRVIHVNFETAWNPPLPVFEKLIRRYRNSLRVKVDYWSFENMVAGWLYWNSLDGCVDHECYDLR